MNNEIFVEDEEESGSIIDINQSQAKQLSEVSIDVNAVTGEHVELNPLDRIKFAAEKFGMRLNDVDPRCKKCNGRGFTGVEAKTQIPIPCQCVIPKQMRDAMNNQFIPQNRKTRRLIEKHQRQSR